MDGMLWHVAKCDATANGGFPWFGCLIIDFYLPRVLSIMLI